LHPLKSPSLTPTAAQSPTLLNFALTAILDIIRQGLLVDHVFSKTPCVLVIALVRCAPHATLATISQELQVPDVNFSLRTATALLTTLFPEIALVAGGERLKGKSAPDYLCHHHLPKSYFFLSHNWNV